MLEARLQVKINVTRLKIPATNLALMVMGTSVAVVTGLVNRSNDFSGWGAAALLFALTATDRARSLALTVVAGAAAALSLIVITGLSGTGRAEKTLTALALAILAALVLSMWLRRKPGEDAPSP
jgi:hypothetical protein